jgi:Tocopherol cyclase
MEGYYWRFTDAASGRCIVALCGVCRAPEGAWAVVALAGHPGGFVRWTNAASAAADPAALGVAAWDAEGAAVLRGTDRRVAVDLGPDARLEAVLEGRATWPRRAFGALGPAHAVPGLPQYWHPWLLHARVRGEAVLGGETIALDGFDAYAEKNWGARFPGRWWWGQAGFGGGAVAAFAGGGLSGPLAASAVVVRTGGEVLRLAPPAALVTAHAGGGAWRLRARSARVAVELDGDGAGPPHILPVPVPAERRAVLRSEHHLAGRLRVLARRGGRVLLREESALAGLELGTPAGA